MADNVWDAQPSAGRSPSPVGNRNRSRSPDRRMQTDDRDDRREAGGDRGRGGVSQNPGNNLHVSGLSNRIEERDLEEAFSKYGRVQRAQVMRDPHTKDPRGFGFVTMETAEEADAAKAGLAGTDLLGKVISIEKARRGRARTPTPGAYHGPPKRDDDRDYGRRSYDRDGRGGGRYDDRRGGDRYGGRDDYRRDDRRDDYRRDDRYERRDDRSYAAPMRDDRRGGYERDDRGYDDRRRE